MVLEAVMICLDNSEYMRNGDYEPNRLDAQNETINFISSHKTQSNQESTVGFLSMAGRRIETHMTPTRNLGAIMTSLQKGVKASGKANFIGGLKTAQLALKNRQNKNQRQRVILFVGSPVLDDVAELVRLAKNFKKNNIAVDIINFGAENMTNENPEKLEAFIQAVNSSDNSHLVTIPPGPHVFSDLVMTSPIIMETAGSGSTSTIASNAARPGGGVGDVDPNLDPELAMVIRMSAEDYKQKQQKKETGSSSSSTTSSSSSASSSSSSTSSTSAPSSSSTPNPKPTTSTTAPSLPPAAGDDQMADDELAQAIAMSMGSEESSESTPLLPASSSSSSSSASSSSTSTTASKPAKKPDDTKDVTDALRDPEFLSSLLESVPGVDLGQGEIEDILSKLTGDDETPKEDKTKDKSKDNKDPKK